MTTQIRFVAGDEGVAEAGDSLSAEPWRRARLWHSSAFGPLLAIERRLDILAFAKTRDEVYAFATDGSLVALGPHWPRDEPDTASWTSERWLEELGTDDPVVVLRALRRLHACRAAWVSSPRYQTAGALRDRLRELARADVSWIAQEVSALVALGEAVFDGELEGLRLRVGMSPGLFRFIPNRSGLFVELMDADRGRSLGLRTFMVSAPRGAEVRSIPLGETKREVFVLSGSGGIKSIEPNWAPTERFYAVADGARLALIRHEKEGRHDRCAYGERHTANPLPPDRSPAGIATALRTDDSVRVLEALNWLGGRFTRSAEECAHASEVVAARSDPAVHAALLPLCESPIVWVREAATLARDVLRSTPGPVRPDRPG